MQIIIIGSGVAGLTAAIAARLAGFGATVLERGSTPPERPGETLHPGLEVLFSQLGVLEEVDRAATSRHSGILVADESGKRRQLYGGPPSEPWQGFQIPRQDLQRILLDRARQLGALVHFDCSARELRSHSDDGLSVACAGQEFNGDWLFDGSGSANWSARCDHTEYHTASPQLTVCYGYENSTVKEHGANWPSLSLDPSGWSWDADLGNGTRAWAKMFTSRSEMLRLRPPGCRSADATWKVSSTPAHDRSFRIGDAAVRVDPSSGRGILRAIMSAIMAVHLMKAVRDGKIDRSAAAGTYSAWITSWFYSDVRELRQLLQLWRVSPPNSPRVSRSTAGV